MGITKNHGTFPALCFCGYSGSGKTTLLEKLAATLADKGFIIGYLKHDAHGFEMDREGKDTFRLFSAGASPVAITSPHEAAARIRAADLSIVQDALFAECDMVLVEGYKNAKRDRDWDWDKVWVHPFTGKTDEVPKLDNLATEIGGGSDLKHDDIEAIANFAKNWLNEKIIRAKPLYGGLLIGGKSKRMGRPKSTMRLGETTFAEKQFNLLKKHCNAVYLLGTGPLPESLREAERIADPPGIEGPLAGLMAAGRFAPQADWLILAVDMPDLNDSHIAKLLGGRKAGFRCVLPYNNETGKPEPLCALYSSQIFWAIKRSRNGETSINRVLKALGVKAAAGFLDKAAFKNINLLWK